MLKTHFAAAAVTLGIFILLIGAASALRAAPAPSTTQAAADGRDALEIIRTFLKPSPSDAASFPMAFPNERLLDQPNSPSITAAMDPNLTRPAADGAPAAAGPAVMVRALTLPHSITTDRFAVPAGLLRGQKIRISGWLKADNLQNWAGLWTAVMGPDGRVDALDTMCDHGIYVSAPWKQYSSVLEVLDDSQTILIGVGLTGKGTVWADGFQITLAADSDACTDDRNWHAFITGPKPGVIDHDPNARRNGHPTTRFTLPPMPQRYAYYDAADRNIEPYRGKRIRMTAWLKCANVTRPSGLSLLVNGPGFRKITDESRHGKHPLLGTSDWQKYEAIADVPPEAQSIYSGLEMVGAGTIWIDEVKLEVVER